jgi:hypothetical protein
MPRASADTSAPRDRASALILSADGLQKWWIGAVRDVKADPSWPAVGAQMSWVAAGGGYTATFEARVTENRLPELLRQEVKTPSGESVITHRFESLPSGGTRYEKTVEPRYKSWGARIMLGAMLWWFVRLEVRRAARAANGAAAT